MSSEVSEGNIAPGVQLGDLDCHESDVAMVETIISNDSDYIGRRLSTDRRVPGRVNQLQFRDYWLNVLKPSSELLRDTIVNGYKLPFIDDEPPPPSFSRNNRSARLDEAFVRAEVLRLESLGCVKRVESQPYIVLPLSSVFSKKKRLVCDASRTLNPFIQHRRVRLQDHRDVPDIVKPGMYFFTEDLDSGYWHLKIHEDHQKFLGICIQSEEGENLFFVWSVLFLGLKDAVFIFTLLLKPIREYLASNGVPNLIYIDDSLVGGDSRELSIKNREFAVDVLSKAGFVISESKSQGPSDCITFLGLQICSKSMKFFVPEAKIVKFCDFARQLTSADKIKVRDMAKLLGLLQSFSKALGRITLFKSRACYAWIADKLTKGKGYNMFFRLDDASTSELMFWMKNIRYYNGHLISPDLSCSPAAMLITDASDVGCFGFAFGDNYEVLLRRSFTSEERRQSSTVRELLAIKFIYESPACSKFEGKTILHLTDNQAAVAIWNSGSRKKHIQEIATEIFETCRRRNIELKIEWRSRDNPLLSWADSGSKSFDSSAFSLDYSSFLKILEFIHPASINVDCCASSWNKKALVYFSKHQEPHSSGVNFFSQSLPRGLFYYAFPPPGLITAFILHLAKFMTKGVLIIPLWRSASFWNNVFPDGKHGCWWMKELMTFKPSGFISDSEIISTTFKNPVNFSMLAVKFDFSDILFRENIFSSELRQEICVIKGCNMCC